jgi:hypothetical protein
VYYGELYFVSYANYLYNKPFWGGGTEGQDRGNGRTKISFQLSSQRVEDILGRHKPTLLRLLSNA